MMYFKTILTYCLMCMCMCTGYMFSQDTKRCAGKTREDSRLYDLVLNGSLPSICSRLCKRNCTFGERGDNENTVLHAAAVRGNLNIMRVLLQCKKCDIHAVNAYGNTPLHLALLNQHQNIAIVLLGYGADPFRSGAYDNTPLHIAAHNNCTDVLNTFFGHAKDTIEQDSLHDLRRVKQFDSPEGNTNIPDVEVRGAHHNVPLHMAVMKGNVACVYSILKCKKIGLNAQNQKGDTALHIAARSGYASIVRALLARGAKTHITNHAGNTPQEEVTDRVCHMLLCHDDMLSAREKDRRDDHSTATLTQVECDNYRQSYDTSEFPTTVRGGQDVRVSGGRVVSHTSCEYDYRSLYLAIRNNDMQTIRDMIAGGCDVNISDVWGDTPLHCAARCGNLSAVACLICENAVLDVVNNHGETPLHAATRASEDRTSIIHGLVLHGSDMYARNHDGQTPLHIASYHMLNNAQALLDRGVHLHIQDNMGNTALHVASRYGKREVIRLLLHHGADHTMMNLYGNTALHLVLMYNHSHLIPVFLPNYVTKIQNYRGQTPLQLADEKTCNRLFTCLLSAYSRNVT